MAEDSKLTPAEGSHDRTEQSPVASVVMPQPKRPYGRSFGDFRDQETESGLSPAEEKLLAAVAQGEKCDFRDDTARRKLREELHKGVSAPEVIKLATEVVASPKRIFGSHFGETKEEAETRVELEARVKAQPRIIKEFITEVPRFAGGHAKGPKDLKVRVLTEPELLEPVLHQLKERFDDELSHWRQVNPADVGVRVRASFLRFLALGGDESAPVHEKGVSIVGAYIEGDLDLAGCETIWPLLLNNCWLNGKVILRHARIQTMNLDGSRVDGIDAVRARIGSSVYLQYGFLAEREVTFLGSDIGGNLECTKGTFAKLNCTNARIAGDLFLTRGFKAEGEVSFAGSDIGGDLICTKGTFTKLNCSNARIVGDVGLTGGFKAEGKVSFHSAHIGNNLTCEGGTFLNYTEHGHGDALICDGAKIMGTVWLTNGFNAKGKVRFIGGHIGRSFYCSGGSFNNAARQFRNSKSRNPSAKSSAIALDLSGVTIKTELVLAAGTDEPYNKNVNIIGSVALGGARVRNFWDHPDSWPPQIIEGPNGEKLTCEIELDGFYYEGFSGRAPTDAKTRKKWLTRQPIEDRHGDGFKPQPFEQLTRVMRNVGHESDAREIAIFKQKCRVSVRRHRARWFLKPMVRPLWFLFGFAVGYGYKPQRLIFGLFAIWLGAALFYQFAAAEKIFAPTDAVVFLDSRFKHCRPPQGNWTKCAEIQKEQFQEYSTFNPLMFSLDVILPVVDLHQENDWQPMKGGIVLRIPAVGTVELPDGFTRGLMWLEIIIGWAGSLLLIALITGIVKKD